MADALKEALARADAPRELSPRFRARLERAITNPEAADEAFQWSIDGPRPMPPAVRARIERTLVPARRPFGTTRSIAAATVVVLVASALLVAVRSTQDDQGGLVAGAPRLRPTDASSAESPRPGSLRRFSSAGAFLSYVRDVGMELTGPQGIAGQGVLFVSPGVPTAMPDAAVTEGPSAAVSGQGSVAAEEPASAAAALPPPPPSAGRARFSSTNVQEAGVDEPDLVKTDGRRLAVMSRMALWVLDVSGETTALRGSLAIPNGTGILLAGDRVLHFSTLSDTRTLAKRAHAVPGRPWTRVTVVDVAQPDAPEVVASLELEGQYVGARLVDGIVRLILRSDALGPAPVRPQGNWSVKSMARAEAANKDIIRRSAVGDWMPHFVLTQPKRPREAGHLHAWDAVSRPSERAGLGMLTVLTIDPADPRPDNALSVIGSGELIYASPTSLYVTSSRLDHVLDRRAGRRSQGLVTRIHTFDIRDPRRARYVGSGTVPGYPLNQFALSEHEGHLRVATTLEPPPSRPGGRLTTESVVTILRQTGGALVEIGSVGDLGKGERIYAVRFIGDRGYVVTFRQVDPLYVIDLSRPRAPRVLGELKIPGFSAYLHPVSEDRLVGVGNDADSSGITGGLQISLFDVSDAARPRRLDAKVVGDSGSSRVQHDHHGFLYWEPKRLIVVPAEWFYDSQQQIESFRGALALRMERLEGFTRAFQLTHEGRTNARGLDFAISRALVVGDRLLTVSEAGILVSDLDTLGDRAWVPLRR